MVDFCRLVVTNVKYMSWLTEESMSVSKKLSIIVINEKVNTNIVIK